MSVVRRWNVGLSGTMQEHNGDMIRSGIGPYVLAEHYDEAEQSRDLNHAAAKMALDQRDEALQALKMLCDHHYTYAGADADTANDHGLYAKVKTARAALAALLKGGATHDSTVSP